MNGSVIPVTLPCCQVAAQLGLSRNLPAHLCVA
jgi:hypothetical protein